MLRLMSSSITENIFFNPVFVKAKQVPELPQEPVF